MRKNKQNRNKKRSGTNLKVSPLKRYKKQVKRMKHRIKNGLPEKLDIYKTRLEGAETHLKNYDKEQAELKMAQMAAKAAKKS